MSAIPDPHLYMNDTSAGSSLPTSEDVRSIGEIIKDTRNLSADQVEQVLQYQRENGVRFGEAAIALGLATPDDVLNALAVQFNYPYSYSGGEKSTTSAELLTLHQPFSAQAEAFRALRAQILGRAFPLQGDKGRVNRSLAVVSPNVGDGKTFFAANLAVSLAQLGGRTLIVDADLRGPRLHEVFGVDNSAGLSSLLRGRRGDSVIKTVPGVPNLFVLPGGVSPPNPLELVEGPAFATLMLELLTRFDHVIVDTPAAIYGSDGCVVAARCGVALVIARKDSVRIDALQECVDNLAAVNAKVVGAVMNEF